MHLFWQISVCLFFSALLTKGFIDSCPPLFPRKKKFFGHQRIFPEKWKATSSSKLIGIT